MTDPPPTRDPSVPTDEGRTSPRRGRRGLRIAVGLSAFAFVVAAVGWALMRAREPTPAEGRPSATLQQAGEEVAVVLDAAAQRRAGLVTQVLRTAGSMGEVATTAPTGGAVPLTGELVADPSGVTTIRAAVPGRLTAPSGHWPGLGERVPAGAVVAQVSDARPLVAPRGGSVTRLGAQPGELVQAGQELVQLADVGALLARIAWRPDAPPPPASLRIVPLAPVSAGDAAGSGAGVARGWPARLVGPAADVDALTRLPVYLYRLGDVSAGARPGLPVSAVMADRLALGTAAGGPGRAAPGARTVLVPTEAVVQWEGLAWVFVQRAPGRFVRVRVDTGRPVRGGWLVDVAATATADALALGDAVVLRGAQQLLSAEFRSRLPKDADGEP